MAEDTFGQLGVQTLELVADDDQLIVLYVNQDDSSQIDVGAVLAFVAEDATTKEQQGWRLVSIGGLPMRQIGTAGNIMFQSGGQYATRQRSSPSTEGSRPLRRNRSSAVDRLKPGKTPGH